MAHKQEDDIPAVRRIAPMRRLLDELDAGMFGWTPAAVMRRVLDDIERMVEREVEEPVASPTAPRTDVRRRGDALVVIVDLPGVPQDKVEISVAGDTLVIAAERPWPSDEVLRTERVYGSLRRVVALPEGVDADRASARFENGVLEISLPLPPAQITRRIAIGGGR